MKLFFDTETTGVPRNYSAPVSDTENWPRLVQLGYVVMEGDDVLLETEYIIKPDGFEISLEASSVHGITTEKALAIGVDITDGLGNFLFWVQNCDEIIGHNVSFDVSIVGAECWRLWQKNPFEGKKVICTMKSSTNFCAIPKRLGSYKYPKLFELYEKLFGEPMGAAHTALQDIQNTAKCYFELVKRGVIV
jgi:DNA polymerase III epsilon subunit-like protein